MKKLIFLLLVFISLNIKGQYNCEAFKLSGDHCKYKACKYIEESGRYLKSHNAYNKALEICPSYHPAYRAKSTAYLKTGDFITWKKLMDKAVELSPEDHLDYRGWCRFQFLRDYEGAIQDIEQLKKLFGNNIGFGQNGMYHLNTALALSYKMIGNRRKAIQIIENHLKNDGSSGLYIHYHLGILYYEKGMFERSISTFEQQTVEYNFAENEYYKSLLYKKLGEIDKQKLAIQKSLDLYKQQVFMYDPYTHQVDKIYLTTIMNEYNNSNK